MASLAIFASLIFIIVIIIGPFSYAISLLKWMPKLIIYLLGLASIFIGVWWFLLPIPAIRYYGLLDAFLGLKILLGSHQNKLKVDKTNNR